MSNNGTKEKHETNRRINAARDILVGKIPDPKAQVEQITTALIYKFMDDMDRSSEALGGNASFIMGELAAYQWGRLMGKEISGTERLHLYSEALLKFSQSERIPEIFRKIFKDAFLPYRDPEILNLFLKEIDWFDYDHSENLGDAFEYLLNILGSQGDAGQFRTPRQIIDFIVKVVKPSKTDKILDPACGTAGFLISAYKFILKNEHLTPQDKQQLMRNFSGYDISPDMVRLSLVNLYLHGFPEPKIQEYDTLTSEKLWNERFDVILANPPFMTPKGGIRPHNRFMVQAKRSEVLFVDYIAEHLTLNGRGGVIVPEGIIFQSAKAYQALRKMLIEDNFLWAVVSLPSGIFQPYSGVKTSILLFDRSVAKQQDSILFVKIANDGFDLGAQRREISKNDLPNALTVLECFQRGETVDHPLALAVSKAKIAASGDFNLTGERYKETIKHNTVYPMVKLSDVCDVINGRAYKQEELLEQGKYLVLRVGNFFTNTSFYYSNLELPEDKYCYRGDLLYAWSASFGPKIWDGEKTIYHYHIWKMISNDKKIVKAFLYLILEWDTENLKKEITNGNTMLHLTKEGIEKRLIPLPPLEIQNAIVAEIEQWQKVIDGAKQVIAHYRPTISIDPNWEMVKLRNLVKVVSGGTPSRNVEEYWNGNIPFIKTGQINYEDITKAEEFITEEGLKNSSTKIIEENTILMALYGQGITRGRVGILKIKATINQACLAFNIVSPTLDNNYLYYFLVSIYEKLRGLSDARGGNQSNLNSEIIKELEIPLPPIEEQSAIVAELEKERAAVDACKQLITQFEAKIKAKIATIWGENTSE